MEDKRSAKVELFHKIYMEAVAEGQEAVDSLIEEAFDSEGGIEILADYASSGFAPSSPLSIVPLRKAILNASNSGRNREFTLLFQERNFGVFKAEAYLQDLQFLLDNSSLTPQRFAVMFSQYAEENEEDAMLVLAMCEKHNMRLPAEYLIEAYCELSGYALRVSQRVPQALEGVLPGFTNNLENALAVIVGFEYPDMPTAWVKEMLQNIREKTNA